MTPRWICFENKYWKNWKHTDLVYSVCTIDCSTCCLSNTVCLSTAGSFQCNLYNVAFTRQCLSWVLAIQFTHRHFVFSPCSLGAGVGVFAGCIMQCIKCSGSTNCTCAFAKLCALCLAQFSRRCIQYNLDCSWFNAAFFLHCNAMFVQHTVWCKMCTRVLPRLCAPYFAYVSPRLSKCYQSLVQQFFLLRKP